MSKDVLKAFKVIISMIKESFYIFLVVGAVIVLVNSSMEYFFERGTADLEGFFHTLKTNIAVNFSGMLFIFSFVSVIVLFSQTINMLLMFSTPRKHIRSAVNTYLFALPLVIGTAVNLLLLLIDVPFGSVSLAIAIITVFYFATFYTGFLALLGKRFGWQYVVGTNILAVCLIMIAYNHIFKFIVFGEGKIAFLISAAITIVLLYFVNNHLMKRSEYKY
jgi:hypothetical protein